jgi:hypothetical protein
VISVGVNRTDSGPAWNLKYAANDSRWLQAAVSQHLRVDPSFSEIVSIKLISDFAELKSDESAATKPNFKVVLDLLAGKRVEAATRALIAGADKIQRAEPEDFVLITFACFGFTDEQGQFRFFLSDMGANQQQQSTAELYRRALSSNELADWLRSVDAGQLALIIDAVQSPTTRLSEGFRPGPMGSRGLGQLAYDKGISILASSASAQSAIETNTFGYGLLTYALVHEGLDLAQADFKPHDGKILMSEWLEYGAQRVLELYSEGELRSDATVGGKGAPEGPRGVYRGAKTTPEQYQQPALFRFAKRGHDALLQFVR